MFTGVSCITAGFLEEGTVRYARNICIWPMLGKENQYIYTRHSNNIDRLYLSSFMTLLLTFPLKTSLSLYLIMCFSTFFVFIIRQLQYKINLPQ